MNLCFDSHAERDFRRIISSGSHSLPNAPKSKISLYIIREGLNSLSLFLLAALVSVWVWLADPGVL